MKLTHKHFNSNCLVIIVIYKQQKLIVKRDLEQYKPVFFNLKLWFATIGICL